VGRRSPAASTETPKWGGAHPPLRLKRRSGAALVCRLYITTGNAGPDMNGSQRAGSDLFSTSIV
jgi:hypothetical protein